MLLLYLSLLVAPASAEWVEISQQHYRKPVRLFTTPNKTLEETTTWNYPNRSILENNWSKPRITNTGNIPRIYIEKIATPETHKLLVENNPPFDDDDRNNFEYKYDYIGEEKNNFDYKAYYKPSKVNEDDNNKGLIRRIPIIGNVKRVQLNDSPVKSPGVYKQEDRDKAPMNRYKKRPPESDESTEVNKPKENNRPVLDRRIYVNEIRKQYNTVTPNTSSIEEEYTEAFTEEVPIFDKNIIYKSEYTNYTTAKNVSPKPSFISQIENDKRFHKIKFNKPAATDRTYFQTTELIDFDERYVTTNAFERPKKGVDSDSKHADSYSYHDLQQDSTESFTKKIYEQNTTTTPTDKQKPTHSNNKDTKDKSNLDPKVNTLENVIKFMKVVADTISQNSRKSFGGKVQYLHELRDTIMTNIEERIDSTWPDDDRPTRRHSRSAQARGHVQFPSSESALMTISFLTFAVFLIKLVLQVIQTYKHKSMMVAPLVVATSRAAFTKRGQ